MDAPVVDLAHTDESSVARTRAAVAIDEAFTQNGFLTVVHHGVHPRLVARAFDAARSYFDAVGDDVDTFAVGTGPLTPAANWPEEPLGFREHWLAYLDALSGLSERLMRLCGLALGAGEAQFTPALSQGRVTLRAQRHPLERGDADAVDRITTLTIVACDGLSNVDIVEGADGGGRSWSVATPPGSFVVTAGHALARWTNDHWRIASPLVTGPTSRPRRGRRTSLALLQHPDVDALIDSVPTCVRPDRPARYAPITTTELERVTSERRRSSRTSAA